MDARKAIKWLENTSTNEAATYAIAAVSKLELIKVKTQDILDMVRDDYSMKDPCFVERVVELEKLLK